MQNDIDDKKTYFNQYWQTRDVASADARSVQRAQMVRSLLNPDKGEKIIDVGCGRGTVLTWLAGHGFRVSGCDISSDTISALVTEGRNVFLCDLEREPLPGKYDVVMCLEVLQQVFDPVAVLHKLKAAMYRGGRLIVSVPNEFHAVARLRLLTGLSHLGHFEESHIRLFTPSRGRQLFDAAGLEIERVINVPAIPPRLVALQGIGRVLAGAWPGMFSLSQIYRLKPR